MRDFKLDTVTVGARCMLGEQGREQWVVVNDPNTVGSYAVQYI